MSSRMRVENNTYIKHDETIKHNKHGYKKTDWKSSRQDRGETTNIKINE